VTLKKLPCVSFAGVDSLDDVKNHTYNELFVSGGFIVSDESILNPEVVTIGKINAFFSACDVLFFFLWVFKVKLRTCIFLLPIYVPFTDN
jgi:hypothetical protein